MHKDSGANQSLLAIDVGNSRIKFGLFKIEEQHGGQRTLPMCLRSMATELDEVVPWDELAHWIDGSGMTINYVTIGGVNPRGRDQLLDGWPNNGWPAPFIVESPFSLPIEIRVDSPRTVGVDRLLNAIAGNVIRPNNRSMIIIDSGTATTVDVVSADGAFEGGAILPGFQLGAQALHQYTAFLPKISNPEMAQKTPEPLGRNTRDALRSGLFWGQLGAVQEIVRLYRKQLPDDPFVVVTGGAGRLLVPHMDDRTVHEPFLALQGIVIVADYLRQKE